MNKTGYWGIFSFSVEDFLKIPNFLESTAVLSCEAGETSCEASETSREASSEASEASGEATRMYI